MIEEIGERKWLWENLEDAGFSTKVNHAVTGCTDERSGRRLMFSAGGFAGRGIVRSRYERWNELGDVSLDLLQFDVGMLMCYNKLYIMVKKKMFIKSISMLIIFLLL